MKPHLFRVVSAIGIASASAFAATFAVTLAFAPPAGAAPAAPSELNALAGEALVAQGAYAFAQSLSDSAGARPAGSPAAEQATAWAEATMKAIGLEGVHREPAQVPGWTRGQQEAALVSPLARALTISTLGGSVGTPAAGLEAPVVTVDSLEALRAAGPRLAGKIVFCNHHMERTAGPQGYIAASALRRSCATAAAPFGAVAALVRSAGTGHHRLAHTGALSYAEGVTRIPAAALAAEDADLLERLTAEPAPGAAPAPAGASARAPVRVRLQLGARVEAERTAWNVVGDLPGSDLRSQIVLVGAHLDSWDVGAGALDDAAGCGLVLDVVRNIRARQQRARRTVRVVLFTAEETGGAGARAYAEAHKAELSRHIAALEADSGAGRPLGYRIAGAEPSLALLRRWVAPLANLVPPRVSFSPVVGSDITPLQKAGVPALGVDQDLSVYFDWHHSDGDTVDKIDRLELAQTSAALTTLVWQIATSRDRLPAPLAPPEK